MRIVITGGAGFLGQAIRDELVQLGHLVTTLDVRKTNKTNHITCNILNLEKLKEAFKGIDVVYHIAGVLGTSELLEVNQFAIDINITGTVNVLEAALHNNVKRVFYPTKPNDWLNTYSITKQAGEQFAQLFSETSFMEIRILRWLNAYGPFQKTHPVRKAVPSMIIEALNNKPLTIWGAGEQPVDLIFTEDLAKITAHYTMLSNVNNEVRDTGCTTRMTVNELADLIIKLTNSKSEKKHFPMRKGEDEDIYITPLDAPTAEDLLAGKVSMTSLEYGMLKTIEYYDSLSPEVHKEVLDFYNMVA